ncbi:hypothetical protein IT570_00960 [Candidatus Sumerlaeota bacterium]|nr:hypothetical protein [Candidatus Sumerlaeota bacterium]
MARHISEQLEHLLSKVPRPLLSNHGDWIECYNGAWKIALEKGLRPPRPWNPRQDWYVDACFAEGIFQWDSCFITFWLKYAQGGLPNIANPLSCLDNFYARQDADGAIAREILADGSFAQNKSAEHDTPDTKPYFNHRAFTNPPLFSWAEWEYYEHTGDESRLRDVLPILGKYFDWYTNHRMRETSYLWYDEWGSGMDNVPRGDAWGWVDYTCQAALDCEFISQIAIIVEDNELADSAAANYLALKNLVNDKMWNEMKQYYSDVDRDDLWTGTLNVGSYWALMADLAPRDRAAEMVKHLRSVRSFARRHMVPALAAHERGFAPRGDYWRGGVWAPTTYMVIRALERLGETELAHHIAVNHVSNVAQVFAQTGTIWENYSPDVVAQGEKAKPDFCGWSALGPIAVLIESVMGIRVYGNRNELEWNLRLEEDHGIENLRVGDVLVNLYARWDRERWHVTATSTGPVDILVTGYGSASRELLPNTGIELVVE